MTEISPKYLKLLADYDKHCQRISLSTTIDIHETAEAKKKRILKLESNYVEWFEYYYPNYAKRKCAWFHAKLASLIINNKRIRQLAEWFRSAAKSVHICMGIPLFLYLVKNDLKFMLLVGETQDKANELLSGIQAQLEHNNRLKNDYGNKFNFGSWTAGDFTTTDGIKFLSIGFRQNPRGARKESERPDYIVCDDVDNKLHVNNDRMMRQSLDYITEDIWGCFDADDEATARFVYANNNFHDKSITNRLHLYMQSVIEQQAENKKNQRPTTSKFKSVKFNILKVCAVKDTVNFQPEWPEKTSSDYWRDLYENTPYRSFMREYMHTHIQDGTIFKNEDIQYCQPLKLKEYESLCFYGDLSYKQNADYKALILVGVKGKEFHIILSYLRQKSRADCAAWLYDQYEDYKLDKLNIRYKIEGLFAMDEFISDFDEEGRKRGYYIPVTADKRPKADKFDRIESLAGHFERRNVFFNANKTGDQQVLIDQFLAFEKGSNAHDDGPDAVHGAIAILNRRTHSKRTTYKVGRRQSFKH